MPTEIQGTRSRSGGMSVSLASPDGRVVGGSVAGLLVAASPVQVSSFLYSFDIKGGKLHVPTMGEVTKKWLKVLMTLIPQLEFKCQAPK